MSVFAISNIFKPINKLDRLIYPIIAKGYSEIKFL